MFLNNIIVTILGLENTLISLCFTVLTSLQKFKSTIYLKDVLESVATDQLRTQDFEKRGGQELQKILEEQRSE